MNQTDPLPRPSGRPRRFDAGAALRSARDLFWRDGYAQTSLDGLVAAMGISRSSFYACFTSKHATLLQALTLYADESFAGMQAIVLAAPAPAAALRAGVEWLADAQGGRRGCFLANCISEFGPHDPQIDRIIQAQLARIRALLSGLLGEMKAEDADGTALLLVTLVLGVIGLRKSGLSAAEVLATLHSGVDRVL